MIKRAKNFRSPVHIEISIFRNLMPRSQAHNLSTKEQANRRQKALSDSRAYNQQADELVRQALPLRETLAQIQLDNAKLEKKKDVESQTLLTTNLQTVERLENEIEPLRARAANLRVKAKNTEKGIRDDLVVEMEALRTWAELGISKLAGLKEEANQVLAWKADELKGKLRKGIFSEDSLKVYANIWAVIKSKEGKRLTKNGTPDERKVFLQNAGWMDNQGRPLSNFPTTHGYENQVMEWVTGEPSTGTKEIVSEKPSEEYVGGIDEVDMTGIDPYDPNSMPLDVLK